jgi:hypothetical protein
MSICWLWKWIHPARPYCWCWWWWKGYHYPVHVQTAGIVDFHRQLLMVLFLLYDIEKSYVNAGMPKKVSPASAFLLVVSYLSPASAFRHQGSVRYHWTRISPALPSYVHFLIFQLPKAEPRPLRTYELLPN